MIKMENAINIFTDASVLVTIDIIVLLIDLQTTMVN